MYKQSSLLSLSIGLFLFTVFLLSFSPVRAGASRATCDIAVELNDSAEQKIGGSLYSGPTLTPDEIMDILTEAHQVHHPQHGGAFNMAPNKMNHIESVYSEACGLRVYLYNAFTQHIHANRFLAFVKFIPRVEDQFEVIRFLQPSKKGDYLGTGADHGVEPPFDIELFMKFPESDVVELFTVTPDFAQQKLFEGIGEVIVIDQGAQELVIDHEAIPGYMGAMKMPYAVSDPELLNRVKVGTRIKFKVDAENRTIIAVEPMKP